MAQWSCLGPLLFILFCNDIYKLPTYSKIILFADDTSLLYSRKSTNFLRYALEHDMRLLIDCYWANKLSLNIAKTILLKYWLEGKSFKIEVNGINIKNAHHTKFLGVLVDYCLSWKGHVNQLINKININKKLLSNTKNLMPIPVLKNIYHAHIYSHITYGLVVWGSMISATDKESIYRTPKMMHTYSMQKESENTHRPIICHIEDNQIPGHDQT